jgi:hypothetical protein
MVLNQQLVLVNRPKSEFNAISFSDAIEESNFKLVTEEINIKEGEALVQIEYLGFDPVQRIWLYNDATFTKSIDLGEGSIQEYDLIFSHESKRSWQGSPIEQQRSPNRNWYFGISRVATVNIQNI